jgi:hypothetical protein
MKYDVTHILTSLKKECQRYGKRHLEIRKMKIKDENIFNTVRFCIKKTMVKSVIYMLETRKLYTYTLVISSDFSK